MHLAYLPDASEGLMSLPEDESKHCVRVLRMREGDPMLISNGKGLLFDAVVQEAHPKQTVVFLQQGRKGYDHWPFELHIAIAPTKQNERLEWFLEKATEIGIDHIHLFHGFHSERRKVNVQRLQKRLVAAMKQSLKSRLPVLHDMKPLHELLSCEWNAQKLMAWIDESVTDTLMDVYEPGTHVLVLIGPEGDFSEAEVKLAVENGFHPISLGPARLRTETAALIACHSIQLLNQQAEK